MGQLRHVQPCDAYGTRHITTDADQVRARFLNLVGIRPTVPDRRRFSVAPTELRSSIGWLTFVDDYPTIEALSNL